MISVNIAGCSGSGFIVLSLIVARHFTIKVKSRAKPLFRTSPASTIPIPGIGEETIQISLWLIFLQLRSVLWI